MSLTRREHARLSRELIAACGGLDEARKACRINAKSTLSDYQNPNINAPMPADVMDDLESYCGKAIYSSALADRFRDAIPTGTLVDQACDLSELASQLQGMVRAAVADERLTPREFDNLARAEGAAEEAFDKLRAARRAAETQRPLPRAV